MNKQEAMDRIAAIEAEAARLRAILDAPEAVPPQVGRICFVSDCMQDCPNNGEIDLIKGIKGDWFLGQTCKWHYARIATWDELGVPWVAEAEKFLGNVLVGPFCVSSDTKEEAKRILAMRDGRTK